MLTKYEKIKFTSGDKITESLGARDFTLESAPNKPISIKTQKSVKIITDTDNGPSTFEFKENGDLSIPSKVSSTSDVVLQANATQYTFGADGVITLPVDGDIVNSEGDSVLGGGGAGVSGDPRLTIHGYLDGVTVPGTAVNYVSFTTGDQPITGLYLTKYISLDNRAWFAIQVGPAWTIPQNVVTPAMVAYGHFGPNAQIVNQLGSNLLATTNYALLPNTTYTMWIQQINAICEYAFSTSVNDQGGNIFETYSTSASSPTVKTIYTSIGQGPAILAENTILNNAQLEGTTIHGQLVEAIRTKSSAGLTVVHDFRTSSTWYHNLISQNFTPNFTNVPSDNERVIQCKLILNQGATPYIPNAIQVNSNSQTINWLGSSTPSGTANKKDVVTFTLIRTGSAWVVLGKLETYGTP